MEYIDKVLAYLLDKIQPGTNKEIDSIAEVPEKFIKTVKHLLDEKYLKSIEFEFSADYKYIKRMEMIG